ncbi:MAG: hypothetical protein HQ558_03175 [Candidatus Omnitrophica bacterium]|nr:hypothetical protein [Candidatus Omnitrophota bacterium]
MKKTIIVIIIFIFIMQNAVPVSALRPSATSKSTTALLIAKAIWARLYFYSRRMGNGVSMLARRQRPFPFNSVKQIYGEPETEEGKHESIRSVITRAIPRPIVVYVPGPEYGFRACAQMTDGDIYLYVDISKEINLARIKEEMQKQLEGVVIKKAFVLSKGLFYVRFSYKGRNRDLYYHTGINAAHDEELPQQVKNGFDVYYEADLVNTSWGFRREQRGYGGQVDTLDILPTALPYMRKGGFLLTDNTIRHYISPYKIRALEDWLAYFEGKRSIPFKVIMFSWDSIKAHFTQHHDFLRLLSKLEDEGIRCVPFYNNEIYPEDENIDRIDSEVKAMGLEKTFIPAHGTWLRKAISAYKVRHGEAVMITGDLHDIDFARSIGAKTVFVNNSYGAHVEGVSLVIRPGQGVFSSIWGWLKRLNQRHGKASAPLIKALAAAA